MSNIYIKAHVKSKTAARPQSLPGIETINRQDTNIYNALLASDLDRINSYKALPRPNPQGIKPA